MSFYFENEDFTLKEAAKDLTEKFNRLEVSTQLDFIAKKIAGDFNFNSVLDCNCAEGELVLKLRELGFNSTGISFFNETQGSFLEKASKYCKFENLNDFLNSKQKQKQDLLISINSFKILKCGNLKKYIKKLRTMSDNIIFGFLTEQGELEELEKGLGLIFSLFIQNNMARNLEIYINTENFKLFYFKSYELEDVSYIFENYENLLQRKNLKELELKNQSEKIKKRNFIYARNFIAMKKIKEKNYQLNKKLMDLKVQNRVLRFYEASFNEIKSSFFWRFTLPFRVMVNFLKKFWDFLRKMMFFILKLVARPKRIKTAVAIFLRYGFKGIVLVVSSHGNLPETTDKKYRAYFKKIAPKEKELNRQRIVKIKTKIVFSIVVPLFNPKKNDLKEMIESVKNQTYVNWQLCLADGSQGKEAFYVTKICEEYSKKDDRIVYKKIGKNLGIAKNTNVAIKMATGNYICFLDQDDILSPIALFENAVIIDKKKPDFLYSDEMTFQNNVIEDITFMHFKPDFSPDTLRSYNYICHFSVFSSKLREEVGFLNSEYDGSQDYDFILRLTEKAKYIYHIPKVLYYWRSSETSAAKDVSLKPYAIEAGKRAIEAHLKRVGLDGKVESGLHSSVYKVNYKIKQPDMVSILIPNKNHIEDLDVCINSILEKTTYENFEILILENGSNFETLDFYEVLKKKDKRIKIITYKNEFNYSALNNYGASVAIGKYFLFLNNDTEIITPNWIQEMLMFAQRKEVGAVGAKLYYPDDTIQHAGVFLKIGGIAGHSCKYMERTALGYATRAVIAQNLSAVTAACLMVRRFCFFNVGGFDENLKISFNDVDFCLKLREKGYLNVFTPFAQAYHYESKSRGTYPENSKEYLAMLVEGEYCQKKHVKIFSKEDPYYNPNLTLKTEDLSVRLD